MGLGIPIIDTVLNTVNNVIDKIFPDKTEADKAKAEIQRAVLGIDRAVIEESARVIFGEVQGQSWLQRNWRPILMLGIVIIVMNNYLVYPYLSLFWNKAMVLVLPDDLWSLMKIGVGGYIIGRSTEKIAESVSGKGLIDRIFSGKTSEKNGNGE